MPKIIHNQTDFTAGELTPRMKGRVGVDRYQNGAETIENGIVVVHGGVVRRVGMRYLATAKLAGARKAVMLPYVYSIGQSFAIELGHLYARVYDGVTGAKIVDGALAPIEIASPYTEGQLATITYAQDSDGLYLFHEDVRPHLLSRITATLWTLVPVQWSTIPFAELGHTLDAKLTLSVATVGTGRTFTTAATTVPGAPPPRARHGRRKTVAQTRRSSARSPRTTHAAACQLRRRPTSTPCSARCRPRNSASARQPPPQKPSGPAGRWRWPRAGRPCWGTSSVRSR